MDPAAEAPSEPLVLYEDSSLVAVVKPPFMHSAPGTGEGDLCAWVFERYPEAGRTEEWGIGRDRSRVEGGLLHRLDFETSGIVLFAREAEAFASLLRQQELGGFRKEYIAVSSVSRDAYPEGSAPREGVPIGIEEDSWSGARERLDGTFLAGLLGTERTGDPRIVACSFRSFGPRGSRVSCLGPGLDRGKKKKAKPIYSSEILGCSFPSVRIDIGTGIAGFELRIGLSRGFRHQVRAHLAWIGLPICGDALYGGVWNERLRLYAVGIAFAHPRTGKAIFLEADAR